MRPVDATCASVHNYMQLVWCGRTTWAMAAVLLRTNGGAPDDHAIGCEGGAARYRCRAAGPHTCLDFWQTSSLFLPKLSLLGFGSFGDIIETTQSITRASTMRILCVRRSSGQQGMMPVRQGSSAGAQSRRCWVDRRMLKIGEVGGAMSCLLLR